MLSQPSHSEPENGDYVARVYRFIDISGSEIHTIEDPEDQLPIPVNRQRISIGSSAVCVESVTTLDDPGICTVYLVRVEIASEPIY